MEIEPNLHLVVKRVNNLNTSAMKQLGIHEPCTENWGAMAPTEQGAFCEKCARQVIDFTSKSNAEIKAVFAEMAGQKVCGRIRASQVDTFNAEVSAWQLNSSRAFQSSLLFSMVVVFGLSLFSCSSEQEKKTILKIQETVAQTLAQPVEEFQPETQQKAIAPIQSVVPAPPAEYPYLSVMEPLDSVVVSDRDKETYDENDLIMLGGMGFRTIWTETPTLVIPDEYDQNGVLIPKVFASKAYPNPAINHTTLEIGLPEKDFVEIGLYDLSGKFIQTVHSGELDRGTHSYAVELGELPAGMYLFVIHSNNYSETVRVVKS